MMSKMTLHRLFGKSSAASGLAVASVLADASLSASEPPAGEPPAAAPAPAGDESVDVVLKTEAESAVSAAKAAGHAAAMQRVEAVFASLSAHTHSADAVFLLCNSDASADKIIAHLDAKGEAAPAPSASESAPAPTANEPTPAQKLEASTPKIDLGSPAASADEPGEPADGGWGDAENRVNGKTGAQASSPFGAGISLPFAAQGKAPAGMEGIAHGC